MKAALEGYLQILNEGKTLTDEQKKDIEAIGIQYGFPVPKKRCKNCYFDVVTQVLTKIKQNSSTSVQDGEESASDSQKQDKKYVLKEGVDVLFCGERVNKYVINDEKAERLVKRGFPLKFFEVVPE